MFLNSEPEPEVLPASRLLKTTVDVPVQLSPEKQVQLTCFTLRLLSLALGLS
ncbi:MULTISPECIES: hypothetical protein [Cyanophyceae]|uniref:hypothetical protein n=1 Tax=Cyanophyceae TaxID=3028117 RepID=UPI001689E6E9|nr:hypothetical protein [Trichocoleus sp. FACHB-40]MBD2003493.1 hypothetical protein [Trichocoleus sp. FACHB-40]